MRIKILLFSLLFHYSFAQKDDVSVDNTLTDSLLIHLNNEVIVTAQRYETKTFTRPETISVLSQKEIRRYSNRTVPEILFGTTGAWIQKTNHGGGSPFIRGLTGQQALILVDGIRMNNTTFRSGPNQYLNTLDPQNISQIELLRGSGAVQYGSDAIGGVLNIITKTPEFSEKLKFNGNVSAKLTSGGMERSSRLDLGISSPRITLNTGFAFYKFGDLIAGKGLGKESPTAYNQIANDAKLRIRLTSKQLLTLQYQDLEQNNVPIYHKIKLENFKINQFEPQRRQMTYARWEYFSANKWLKQIQFTGSYQRMVEGRESQKNNTTLLVKEKDQTKTNGLILTILSEPKTYWKISSGMEMYMDNVRSERKDIDLTTNNETVKRGLYPDKAKMNSFAVFLLNTLNFNCLTLTAGGRFNSFNIKIAEQTLGTSSIKPSALVGNLGISYAIIPQVRIIGLINSAFRAPNVDDMGTLGIVDFRYEVPNTNLEPEKSFNKELGVKVKTKRLSANFVYFHNQLKDIIGRTKTTETIQGYSVYLKENITKAFIRGYEFDAAWKILKQLSGYGNLVYTYGQNETGSEPFRRIPPMNGRMGLNGQVYKNFYVQTELMFASRQDRLAKGDIEDNRINPKGTPSWKVFNILAGYEGKSLSVNCSLNNIFNEAYRIHGSGVDGLGRNITTALYFKW